MLLTRVISACIALPVFCGALLLLPRNGWALFLLPMVMVGAREWAALSGYPVRQAWVYAAAVSAGAVFLLAVSGNDFDTPWIRVLLAFSALFWVLITPLWLRGRWHTSSQWLMGLVGAVVLLATWAALVILQADATALLVFMGIVWISDTGAYFAGRALGRHKLAPSISPGKTWEGVGGAFVAVGIYYLLLWGPVMSERKLFSMEAGLALFLGATILGIMGDLFESLLKRQAGVKDSGRIMPGHGGVLDRIDSLTSAMPPVALLLVSNVLK